MPPYKLVLGSLRTSARNQRRPLENAAFASFLPNVLAPIAFASLLLAARAWAEDHDYPIQPVPR